MCKDLGTFFPYDVAQTVHVKQHATSVTTYCAHSCWQLKNKLCYTTAKEDTENCGTVQGLQNKQTQIQSTFIRIKLVSDSPPLTS